VTKARKVGVVSLVGGTHDGEVHTTYAYQRVAYLQKRITMEESKALDIDGAIAWKPPEEVYRKGEDGRFYYSRTVHYRPDDALGEENG
jgi:hypothetical protein